MGEEKEKEPTKALARMEPVPMTVHGLALRSFDDLQRFCSAAIASRYFRGVEDVAQAIVKIQYGAELGIPPVSSMQGVYIVEGKPSLSAGLIAARIKSSGRYDYRVEEMSDRRCALVFFQDGREAGPSEFTIENAKDAGVAGKDVWRKYPRNMLFARAISNGARWYCPDVFMGSVYTPEELGGSETIEVERQPPSQSRAPQASTPSRPGQAEPPSAQSAPAGALEPEPPPHDDADAGPIEDSETPWEHARNAAAVKAAEAELGAKVEDVKPPPQPKPTNFWAHCKSLGLDKPIVDAMLVAEFGHAEFSRFSVTDKRRAAALATAEANRRREQGKAIVRGAKRGAA